MLHQISTKLTPILEYDFEDSPLLQQVAFSGYLLLPNYPLQKPVAYHILLEDVSINIRGNSRITMPKIFGNGFYIKSVIYHQTGVAVSQRMNTESW